jgi:eukaryotic-like serine/threonine-protein kinase
MPDSGEGRSTAGNRSTVPFSIDIDALPPDGSLPLFAPGQLIGGRYEVVRFVARGGMGEVYECNDRELGQRIALKTLRARGVGDPVALERLKREILIARQVTHPNVCRLHDVGFHSSEPQLPFLTMEFLAGETLETRIRRDGQMSAAEARPIVEQMAAALAAAHAAGVVHRDFKSQNVMLVDDRAVVTDFGLACIAAPPEDEARLTHPGAPFGTPAYMAPEQVAGEAITPAADLYALGVVMFELVTGSLPFSGGSPLELAFKRLNAPPPSLRSLVPSLDPAWDAAITRCLARRPADRFPDASAVLLALAQPPRRRWRRRLVAAAAVAVALIVAFTSAALLRPPPPDAAAPRRTVAVMGVKNATGRTDVGWIGAALDEMVSAELAAGEELRAVSGDAVARARRELGLTESDGLGDEMLARIRRRLGVDVVVTGSYVVLGTGEASRVRLDLRLQDAATGASLGVVSGAGGQNQLFETVSGMGPDLRRRLGASSPAATELQKVRAVLPRNREAARLYVEGLAHSREFEFARARAALEKAVALEPGFPLAHALLAELLSNDQRAARLEAQRALDSAAGLPRELHLLVEARHAWATRDYARAAKIYLTLHTFFPDEVEYGYTLARAQIRAQLPREALATIEELQRRPGPAQTDPMVDLVEARAASKLGDRKRWQAAAARAAAKARARGATSVLADAELEGGEALENLGEPVPAAAAFERARAIYAALGDRPGMANALVKVGDLRLGASDFDAARTVYGQVIPIYRLLEDDYRVARTTSQIGVTFWGEGRFTEARKSFEEAVGLWSGLGDREGVAWNTSHLGLMLDEQGDLTAATEHYRQALAIHREIGMRAGEAEASVRLANAQRERGELAAADEALAEPLAMWREMGDLNEVASTLAVIGDVARDRGDSAQALRSYEEAQSIARQVDDRILIGQLHVARATLALDEGRAAEAAAEARAAAETFRAIQADARTAVADEVLARALLALGDRSGARAALARVHAVGRLGEQLALRFWSAVTAVRLAASDGNPAAGAAQLGELLRDPAVAARPALVFEGRLALAEVRSEHAALARLAADATARGYASMARRARSLRESIRRRTPPPARSAP